MADKYTEDEIKEMAAKVADEIIACNSDMHNCMLMDIIEALERGEDVDDGLAEMILSRPFMDRLTEELRKREE